MTLLREFKKVFQKAVANIMIGGYFCSSWLEYEIKVKMFGSAVGVFAPSSANNFLQMRAMMHLNNNCLFMQLRIIECWVNDPDQWIST